MLPLLKKSKTVKIQPLLLSPIYCNELCGLMYDKGELVPHARMKVMFEGANRLVGLIFKGTETLFFVATHPNVIEHIKQQGCVPLCQTLHLNFFKEKKRMNRFISKVA
jgi:hypothetical protein